MFDQVIAARESSIADAVAVRNSARELGPSDSVYGGLVTLKVGEAGKLCGGGAVGDVANPCPIIMLGGLT